MSTVKTIAEFDSEHGGGRLGRHAQWDSRNYRVSDHLEPLPANPPRQNIIWGRTLGPWDQGDLGACTEFAFCGCARTLPLSAGLTSAAKRKVAAPVGMYEQETATDDIPGQWPPDDTGSTVLAAMKLGVRDGIIGRYLWAQTHAEAVQGLTQIGPAQIGINWYEGFDTPDAFGVVTRAGQVRGGHSVEVLGRIWVQEWYWLCINSWGRHWPEAPANGWPGRFLLAEAEVFRQLDQEEAEIAYPHL